MNNSYFMSISVGEYIFDGKYRIYKKILFTPSFKLQASSMASDNVNLRDLLSSTDYALCISPGFFRYYCYIGLLQALEDQGCLRATHVAGASAGALVGGFLASGR
jgi:hypothetical protein